MSESIRRLCCSALLAALCSALASGAPAQDADPAARDLSVEQAFVQAVQAPASGPGSLGVTAWVDQDDNTYAVGERVRLYVRPSKDAWITVLNVGPSGRTTMLFPNAQQRDNKVSGGRTVEIPSPGSDARITARAPLGRELIKVIATTSPVPLFSEGKMRRAGFFATLGADARSLARDLQVALDSDAGQEWDEYDKIITTVAER